MSVDSVSASNMLRMSGLASGMDTDTMVSKLMTAEKIPYTKLGQKKQLMQWKSDAYRDISNQIIGFKSTYFDVLKPSSNMRSINTYKQYTTSSTSSTVATATASGTASAGTHTITVNNLAAASSAETSSTAAKSGTVLGTLNLSAGVNDQFNIDLAGTTKSITLTAGNYDFSNTTSKAQFINDIQNKLNSAFGSGAVQVNISSDNRLMFKSVDSTKDITITDGANSAVASLGFASGDVLKTITSSTKLSDVKGKLLNGATITDNNIIKFNINGVDVLGAAGWDISATGAQKDKTVGDLLNAVNGSSAGVTMTYNALSDKFKLESKSSGTSSNISLTDSNGYLTAMGLNSVTPGVDAVVTIDGVTTSKTSNNFSVDGVNYTIAGAGTSTIGVTQDVDSVVQKIKDFIDKYNNVVQTISDKISEKYDRNYQPLTDDQKSSMKDADITNWETKAKTGLLHNDSTLSGMINKLRTAVYSPVEGTTETLSSVGITTGSWYENGKLYVDDDKLKAALQKDPDGVTKLFASESSIAYNPNASAADRAARTSQNGVVNKIYDIVNDNVRTTNGKGNLLQVAGISGDLTEFNNTIYNQIKEVNTQMTDMQKVLNDKETAYYNKFSKLETYMNNMNSQSQWLSQQLGNM